MSEELKIGDRVEISMTGHIIAIRRRYGKKEEYMYSIESVSREGQYMGNADVPINAIVGRDKVHVRS